MLVNIQISASSLTYITAHEDNKYTPSDVSVHALLLGELKQSIRVTVLSCRCALQILLSLHEWVMAPCCADEPPFAFGLRGVEVI